ncbi:MAG: 2Fe-2S iron-sulfur cluster-binding protein, partial [Candidatus Bathyarchaeota archaeon]|nr:2Fe-2S iron-sulfur cluster-binding protein [Candidatus Bathyarchaeota archaeon]
MTAEPTLIFQPYGKRIRTTTGKTVLEVAREIGVSLSSICGGEGHCGKCRIIIREGKDCLAPPSEAERHALSEDDLRGGFRLACQTTVAGQGSIVIEVPHESQTDKQRLLLQGLEKTVKLAPAVEKVTVRLKKPSLRDTRADIDRSVEAVESKIGLKPKIDNELLKAMPHILREGDWTVTATLWKAQEVISVEPSAVRDLYGFAVDVGTTKLAGHLIDLNTGTTIASASMMNPQITYGEDVISRIRYIMED